MAAAAGQKRKVIKVRLRALIIRRRCGRIVDNFRCGARRTIWNVLMASIKTRARAALLQRKRRLPAPHPRVAPAN